MRTATTSRKDCPAARKPKRAEGLAAYLAWCSAPCTCGKCPTWSDR